MQTIAIRTGVAILVLGIAALATGCGPQTPSDLVVKGKAEMADKNPAAAAVRFKAALQALPTDTATRALLGQALAQAGDSRGAVVELNRALEQRANPSDVLPWLALAMIESGQHKKLVETHAGANLDDKASQAAFKTHMATAWGLLGNRAKTDAALAEAFAAVPDFTDALVLQARTLLLRGDADAALALMEKLLAREPKDHRAWYLKGEALIAKKASAESSEAALRKALEYSPGYTAAHSALVVSRLRNGDQAGAKKQLESLNSYAPNNQDTVFLTAQMAFLERDYRKAREGVQQMLRSAPENTNVLQLAAAIEWQGGSLVIAQKMLETALRLEPSLDTARVNLAHINIRLGQPGRALSSLEPLLKGGVERAAALAAAGEAASQMGRFNEAEAYYLRAAKAAPEDQYMRTALAMTQLAKGEAGVAFAQLELLAPQSKDGYVDSALASARLSRGELDAALAAVDALIRKSPNSAGAHELRGRVMTTRRDPVAARQAYEKSLSLEPRSLAAVLALAEMDLTENQPEKAKARYDALLQSDPRNHAAITGLADLRIRAGVPAKEVQASLLEAIKLAPDEVAPRLKLVELLSTQRQVKNALAAAQEASAAMPNDVQVLDALGRALLADGNTQQALVTFRRITSIDPNLAAAHLRVADVHLKEGNRSAAVASLRRALDVDPRQRDARSQIVNLLVEEKRSKEALEIAADMQKREPKSAGGYLLEGAIHRKLQNHVASAAAYRRGLQQSSESGDLPVNLFISLLAAQNWKQAEPFALDWLTKNPLDGALRYNLGEGYMINKNYPAAQAQFERAVLLRPDHVPSLNNLAWLLVQQGKPGAVALARQAEQLAPNQPAVLDTLASALAAEKQWAQALEVQRKAVAVAPGDALMRFNLAKIAVQAGDKALAKSELDRLMAMGTRNPFRDDAARMLKDL